MTPKEQNKGLDAWQTSAWYWDKYRALIAQMVAPLMSGLVEEARIGIGQKVLDIGGGSDEPSGEKSETEKGMVEILSFPFWRAFCSAIYLATTRAQFV